jgi:ribose transport system substrate-binding protein
MIRHFSVAHFSVLSLFLAITLAGCNSATPAVKQSAGTKGTVGCSVLTLGNPFFRVIADNLTAELKKNGYDTIIVSGEFDPARQQQQVNDFITANRVAIVLCPCNSQAVGAAIEEANKKGIPVFTAGYCLLSARSQSRLAHRQRQFGWR